MRTVKFMETTNPHQFDESDYKEMILRNNFNPPAASEAIPAVTEKDSTIADDAMAPTNSTIP